MIQKYIELKEDAKVYILAQRQEDIEMRYRSEMYSARLLGEKQGEARGKIEGLAEGLAEGEAQGIIDGKQSVCITAIEKRYHVDSKEWVETLSLNQLDSVFDVIYSEDDYDSFKVKIESL